MANSDKPDPRYTDPRLRWAITGIALIVFLVFLIIQTEIREYLGEIAEGAVEFMETGAWHMELIIGLLAFLVGHYFKIEPMAENEQRVRKILWWKFWSSDAWRGTIIGLALLAFYLGGIAPFHLHTREHNQLSGFITASNMLASQVAEDVKFKNWEVHVWQKRLAKTSPGEIDPGDWTDCGDEAVGIGDYRLACEFYDYAVSQDDHTIGYCEARVWPYYAFAILETNTDPKGNFRPDAIGKFRDSIESEMSTNVSKSVTLHLENAFTTPVLLSPDGLIQRQFIQIKKVLTSQGETSTVQFLDGVISNVNQLGREALANHNGK